MDCSSAQKKRRGRSSAEEEGPPTPISAKEAHPAPPGSPCHLLALPHELLERSAVVGAEYSTLCALAGTCKVLRTLASVSVAAAMRPTASQRLPAQSSPARALDAGFGPRDRLRYLARRALWPGPLRRCSLPSLLPMPRNSARGIGGARLGGQSHCPARRRGRQEP
jgi:hypothetical protein